MATGPVPKEGPGTVVGSMWVGSRCLATILDPFRTILVIWGPTPELRLQQCVVGKGKMSPLPNKGMSSVETKQMSFVETPHASFVKTGEVPAVETDQMSRQQSFVLSLRQTSDPSEQKISILSQQAHACNTILAKLQKSWRAS